MYSFRQSGAQIIIDLAKFMIFGSSQFLDSISAQFPVSVSVSVSVNWARKASSAAKRGSNFSC